MKLISTEEAARALNLSSRRVRALIEMDRVKGAVKVGKNYVIPEASLATIKIGKVGRPKRKAA